MAEMSLGVGPSPCRLSPYTETYLAHTLYQALSRHLDSAVNTKIPLRSWVLGIGRAVGNETRWCVGAEMMKRTGKGDSGCIRAEAWERRRIQEGILRRVLPIQGADV